MAAVACVIVACSGWRLSHGFQSLFHLSIVRSEVYILRARLFNSEGNLLIGVVRLMCFNKLY